MSVHCQFEPLNNMKHLALIFALALSGCSSRVMDIDPVTKKFKIRSNRFANKETITEIDITAPDGTRFRVRGFKNDQAEALAGFTEAAARGAVAGALGNAPAAANTAVKPTASTEEKKPSYKMLTNKNGAVILAPTDD